MLQTDQFKMRISPQEKRMLFRIAQRQERSQSDVLRKIIRETYRAMQQEPNQGKQSTQDQAAIT